MKDIHQPASADAPQSERLYPASIAYLIEERHLLWYENADEYDALRRAWFAELDPRGVIDSIFAKNLVDLVWERRRTMKLIQAAVSYFMPTAAGKLISPVSPAGFDGDPKDQRRVRTIAGSVIYGTEAEDLKAGEDTLAQRMDRKCITHEMLHFHSQEEVAEREHYLRRERDRIEDRIHRLLKDFEARRASMAAQARTLVERETAQVIDAEAIN